MRDRGGAVAGRCLSTAAVVPRAPRAEETRPTGGWGCEARGSESKSRRGALRPGRDVDQDQDRLRGGPARGRGLRADAHRRSRMLQDAAARTMAGPRLIFRVEQACSRGAAGPRATARQCVGQSFDADVCPRTPPEPELQSGSACPGLPLLVPLSPARPRPARSRRHKAASAALQRAVAAVAHRLDRYCPAEPLRFGAAKPSEASRA